MAHCGVVWIDKAACAGSDPALFDHARYPQALAALGFCMRCTVRQECLAAVRPGRSFFDGVCGGVVWRNGYRVRPDNTSRGDRNDGEFLPGMEDHWERVPVPASRVVRHPSRGRPEHEQCCLW